MSDPGNKSSYGKNLNISLSAAEASAGPQIALTDIMPNTNFHVPDVTPQNDINPDLKVTQTPQDTARHRQDVGAVESEYLKQNQIAMNVIAETMQEVDPKNGAAVFKAIFPQAEATKSQAVATAADPTGIMGSVAAVINAIRSESKRPDDSKINAVLEQTLAKLHEESVQAQQAGYTAYGPKTNFNFDKIQTPKQLLDFIQRDPKQDPVMREVADAYDAIDDMDKDRGVYEAHYDDKITADKTAAAFESDNAEFLVKVASVGPSFEYFRGEPKGMTTAEPLSPDVQRLLNEANKIAQAAFDKEPNLKPDIQNKISAPTMMA